MGSRSNKRSNLWTTFGFVVFGTTALYGAGAVLLKRQGIVLPGHWFLLGAGVFVASLTTGALKEGKTFGRFYDGSRDASPLSFWASVVIGYAVAVAIGVLFIMQLSK